MSLSLKQLDNICLWKSNDFRHCRYLATEDNMWFCLKKSFRKAEIDEEINEEINSIKKKGNDPKKQGFPLGDNCQGYPILRHIKQGYDIP